MKVQKRSKMSFFERKKKGSKKSSKKLLLRALFIPPFFGQKNTLVENVIYVLLYSIRFKQLYVVKMKGIK